ncbi:MAG TPA: hypothetical protein VFJ14_05285 [Nocardioidaceae bacterium]|nr:hypothetical protein [Nocardioidaceae bacterium]
MPHRKHIDQTAVDQLLAANERVVTHSELREVGIPSSTITFRILPGGPWQRILPGVVLAHSGIPTWRERCLAAVKCCGTGAVLTGLTALRHQGQTAAHPNGQVNALIPHGSQRGSHDFVQVERSRRMPKPVIVRALPCAPVARALVDACRRQDNLDQVRALVADAIQNRRCTLEDLHAEVGAAARQRTALTRAALCEIDAGIRSVAEAKVKQAMQRRRMPPMEWNVSLLTVDGDFVGTPDGYYADVAVALQLDSIEYHLSPQAYKRTQARQRALTTAQVLVLPYAPGDAIRDPDTLCNELQALCRQGRNRRIPELIVVRKHTAA